MTLDGVAQHGIVAEIDQRADLGGDLAHGLTDVVFVVVAPGRVLVELEDLLFEGHPFQKRIHTLLDEHLLPGGYREGAPHGVMGRQLCPARLLRIERPRSEGVSDDRLARQRLEPRTGRRIAAVGGFEMVSVAVERIAQRRGASVLDRRARGDHAADPRRVVQRTAHAPHDAAVHRLLVAVVERELAVFRIPGIGPRLVEPDLQRGVVHEPSDMLDQIAQIGLVGRIASRLAAGLLQGHDVPRLVGQRAVERHAGRLGAHAVDDLAVTVGAVAAAGVVPVAFERATPDEQVADHGVDPGGIEQLPEVLLDGILREAVADGQNFQRPGGCLRVVRGGGCGRGGRSCRGVRRPGREGRTRQQEQERRKQTAEEVSFHGFISAIRSFVIRPEPDRAPRCVPRRPWSRHPRP